eukprot:COSAG05_NODE_1592_length_4464_cov_7.822485_3_plen_81_part_00
MSPRVVMALGSPAVMAGRPATVAAAAGGATATAAVAAALQPGAGKLLSKVLRRRCAPARPNGIVSVATSQPSIVERLDLM